MKQSEITSFKRINRREGKTFVHQSTNLSYKTLIMKSTHHLMQKKFHTSSDHDSIETAVDVDTPAKNIRYVGS